MFVANHLRAVRKRDPSARDPNAMARKRWAHFESFRAVATRARGRKGVSYLPELCADLVTALSTLDVNDFPVHVERTRASGWIIFKRRAGREGHRLREGAATRARARRARGKREEKSTHRMLAERTVAQESRTRRRTETDAQRSNPRVPLQNYSARKSVALVDGTIWHEPQVVKHRLCYILLCRLRVLSRGAAATRRDGARDAS